MNRDEKHQIQQLIRETVVETVPTVIEQVLQRLGLDTENVLSTQADLAHLRRLRKGSEVVKGVVVKSCLGALVTGVLFIGGLGIKEWIMSIVHGGTTP